MSACSEQLQAFLQSDEMKSRSESTRKTYEAALASFVMWHGLIKDVTKLNSAAMTRFCKHLDDANVAGSTIQYYLRVVKMLLKFHGHTVKCTWHISHEERKAVQLKHKARWFNESDIDLCRTYQFPNVTSEIKQLRNSVIVKLLIDTGVRVEELCFVKGEDVNTEKGMLFIEKSKTVPRHVFFSANTGLRLQSYITQLHPDMFDGDVGKLFPTKGAVQTIVNEMLKDLGLKNGSDGRGPHTFRHFVATYLHYEGDMSLADIGFLLGDTPDTIRDNYIHPTPEMLQRRVIKAMGWDNI